DIDVQGARQLKRTYGDAAVAVMVLPPSWDELERRLRARRTEDDASLARRLGRAREEARAVRDYDYCVVNDDAARVTGDLEGIVRAERVRVARIVDGATP